jgi:hypothetical protein
VAITDVLRAPDRFELLALDPRTIPDGEFHGWRVLGWAAVTDPGEQARLVGELERAVAAAEGGYMCFDPRHGVRAARGGRAVDLVICFECGLIEAYLDGQRLPGYIETARLAEPVLDAAALRAAGVPLAGKAGPN